MIILVSIKGLRNETLKHVLFEKLHCRKCGEDNEIKDPIYEENEIIRI